MNDLRTFATLQARLYEFLEQQDETTLRAIVDGSMRLAVVPAGDAQAPASARPTVPSKDPARAAQDFSRLASEQERRDYLNAVGLSLTGLRKLAKLLGLTGYSKLARRELTNLLVYREPEATESPAGPPTNSVPPLSPPLDLSAEGEQLAPSEQPDPSMTAASTETIESHSDIAAIAARLRETETEEEGAAYLRAQHLTRESLLAVAAELQLTRVDRLSQTELEKRVLRQAIGARRKFAGLRRW